VSNDPKQLNYVDELKEKVEYAQRKYATKGDLRQREDGYVEYVTKDSGEREQYDSGAVRDVRQGKGRYDLISFLALHRIAGVYERGATKYDDRNWEKGMPIGRTLDSALRHIGQYSLREDDEDHLAQAAWNLIAALHFDEGIKRGVYDPALDDRPVYLDLDAQAALKFAADDDSEGEAFKQIKAEHEAAADTIVPELEVNERGWPTGNYVKPVPDVAGRDVAKMIEDGEEEITKGGGTPLDEIVPNPNLYGCPVEPIPEVQYSSDESFRSQTVMHDPNHSESEGVWHWHDYSTEGNPAYPCKPAEPKSYPHTHRKKVS
jgi:Domain of unknown function (DUF5664)